ncbi:MAG: 1-aminocyclopropane-carboxylate deaminase [Gemmatimonadetes bacterium]|nr:1-aminocyclopropane-carboxylate deaminase [Gemmatimonadota bacterium]
MSVAASLVARLAKRAGRVAPMPAAEVRALYEGQLSPLLQRFPGLQGRLPWMPIADLPTPVGRLPDPGMAAAGSLWVKRDDLTSSLYGGNKVRKFEHVLAHARLVGARSLVTIGGLGSNQALAASLHGRTLGLKVALALSSQPVTANVERNARADAAAGAQMHFGGGFLGTLLTARRVMNRLRAGGDSPYFITVGATSRLTTAGYVNAALELASQVRAGLLPEPDRLFVAAGTCGTAAGLVAGLRIAGLRTRVTAVRVVDPLMSNAHMIAALANETIQWLHELDNGVPSERILERDFEYDGGWFGDGYGHATQAGRDAVAWAEPALHLETTYTGKALAACLEWCRGEGASQVGLFWNSYNSAELAEVASLAQLPLEIRQALTTH